MGILEQRAMEKEKEMKIKKKRVEMIGSQAHMRWRPIAGGREAEKPIIDVIGDPVQ
jgi:hypothetical protein